MDQENLWSHTKFVGILFVTTKLGVQPRVLWTIIDFPDDCKSIIGTTLNDLPILVLVHTKTSMLGNLLVVPSNSIDWVSLSLWKTFDATKVPAPGSPTVQQFQDPTSKLVTIPVSSVLFNPIQLPCG